MIRNRSVFYMVKLKWMNLHYGLKGLVLTALVCFIYIFNIFLGNIISPNVNGIESLRASPVLKPLSETSREVRSVTGSDFLALVSFLPHLDPNSPFESVNLVNKYYILVNPYLGDFYSDLNGTLPKLNEDSITDETWNIIRTSWHFSKKFSKNDYRTLSYSAALLVMHAALTDKLEKKTVLKELAGIYEDMSAIINNLGESELSDYTASYFLSAFLLLQIEVFRQNLFCIEPLKNNFYLGSAIKQLREKNRLVKRSAQSEKTFVSQAINKINLIQDKCGE